MFDDDRAGSRLAQLCLMRVERTPSTVTVHLQGEFDRSCVEKFERELPLALDDAPQSLVLDLRRLGFIDSSGLGVLVALHREASERGIFYRVLCDEGEVRRVLEDTGLDGVLPLVGQVGAVPQSEPS